MFFVFLTSFLFFSCGEKDADYTDPRGSTYASNVSCMECHQDIYNASLNSSHFKSSAHANIKNVLGHFDADKNIYIYDQNTKIVMEKRNNEYFQVYYKNNKEVKAYRLDIVMGAKNAQTSMFWDKNNIFELPLTFYDTANHWGTSPSYPPDKPHFDRNISVACFECHSSHIEQVNKNSETDGYFGTEVTLESFKKESLIYGIDCQRCHGPALEHVGYHKKNPQIKLAQYIVTQKSLNRDQKLAQCVICHYSETNTQSRFEFVPGKTLKDFYNEADIYANANQEVHGNQYGLLSQSKCFTKSETMDCITCHSPHHEKKENLAELSNKCLNCHSESKQNFCSTKAPKGMNLKDNCIDCHMPTKPSQAISFYLSGKTNVTPYLLRTHKIGIYANGKKHKDLKNTP